VNNKHLTIISNSYDNALSGTSSLQKRKPGGFLLSMERGVHLAFQQGEISSGKVFGKLNLNFF
jgi:hypothetical protein